MANWKRISFLVTLTLLIFALLLTPNTGWAQDYQGAMAVWRQQADRGDAEAQNSLGDFYLNGWGVTKDAAEAMKWFSKAADQKYADAQFNIGGMYEDGTGVKQDAVQAYKWYSLAANGEATGPFASRLKMLADKMTPEQIGEGKRLASEWKPPSPPSGTVTGTLEENKAPETCTPPDSDFQALALSPSKLSPEGFSALAPAQQKLVCGTRQFNKQIAAQKGIMDKMKRYSPKYLSPAENDRIVDAGDEYLARILKAKGF